MHHKFILFATAMVLSIGSYFVHAVDKDPASIIESLFGDQVRAVASTRARDDDVALAKQMLDAEASLRASPGVAPLLCERAYDLTVGYPEGVETMIASMTRLAEAEGGKPGSYRPRVDGCSRASSR